MAKYRRHRAVPVAVSRLLYVAATLIVIRVLFGGTLWVQRLTSLFSTLNFPIDGPGTLGLAGLFVILGLALARRKRVAWWFSLVLFALMWAVGAFFFVVLVIEVASRRPTDSGADVAMASYIFNAFSIGVILTALINRQSDFKARLRRGNLGRAVVVLLAGLAASGIVGYLTTLATGGRGGSRGRLANVFQHVIFGSRATAPQLAPDWVQDLVGLMVAITLFAALIVLLRSARSQAAMPLTDEVAIRHLLAEAPSDSLGYFATRRDKVAVFSPDRLAAIAYRTELGVCLASGDPIGRREHWPAAIAAWLDMVRSYGWIPGVVGASELAAQAYTDAGLRALRVGDEAILRPESYQLDDRELRPVRQAVQRLERLGYTVRIRRHRQIPPAELDRLAALSEVWLGGVEERGFSMALGRMGDPLDGDCLLVEALAPVTGEPMGLLSFVPWGRDGASLDVMRRSPAADNGVTELMVSKLMAEGREVGLQRVSLNFAVFRSAFEEGSRIGAGPMQRFWRRFLILASRWWQLESLYRSNVKYAPEWQPRLLCYEEPADIASVGAAMGVAEGQIDVPRWLRPFPPPPQHRIDLSAHPELLPLTRPPESVVPEVRPEQVRARMATRQALLDQGVEAYPASFCPTTTATAVAAGAPGSVRVAGRVIGVRDHGGVIFVTLQDWSGQVQVLLDAGALGHDSLARFGHAISLGDHCGFDGVVGRSRNGTPSLLASGWTLTAKSLRPLPDKHKGMHDPEARVRRRYLDLIVNDSARRQLRARSATIRSVRETLQGLGYLEVETPILQTIHGGANARPFRTHINAYDLDLYLRIAPELYLKRLMVGGVDRVFEIGRNFRNEGADATHNPEFTMLEAYQSYGDYTVMRGVAQQIITDAARAALGGTVVRGRDARGAQHEVDLAEPWRVVTVNEALSAASGEEITADTSQAELVALADRLQINVDPSWTRGNVLLELYEHLCEHGTVAPTFFCDFPAAVSPLTRQHRRDDRLAERWDLVAFGAEIGTAYSELVDPVIQRARLTEQSLRAAGGDPEAMELDEDFLLALEYAMPPSGGLGMGVDRLVMMLTDASIRETISFPLVRPRR